MEPLGEGRVLWSGLGILQAWGGGRSHPAPSVRSVDRTDDDGVRGSLRTSADGRSEGGQIGASRRRVVPVREVSRRPDLPRVLRLEVPGTHDPQCHARLRREDHRQIHGQAHRSSAPIRRAIPGKCHRDVPPAFSVAEGRLRLRRHLRPTPGEDHVHPAQGLGTWAPPLLQRRLRSLGRPIGRAMPRRDRDEQHSCAAQHVPANDRRRHDPGRRALLAPLRSVLDNQILRPPPLPTGPFGSGSADPRWAGWGRRGGDGR